MRQLLVIMLLLSAIVGSAYWYYQAGFRPEKPTSVRVETIQGAVTKGDSEHTSQPLREGESLSEGSHVATGVGSAVTLSVQEGENLHLSEDSEVVINKVTNEGVNFELRKGQVEANVKQFRARSMRVGIAGNPVAVQTQQGTFTVFTDGHGRFDAAAVAGQVSLVNPDASEIRIPIGEHRAVSEEGEQVLGGAIPRSVLLKVNWPDDVVRRQKVMDVTGKAAPGAVVKVEGKPVRPDSDGSFSTQVILKEGANRVKVEAFGLGEPALETSPAITVDSRPPTVSTHTDELWK